MSNMRHKKVLRGFKDANVKKPILVLSQAILRVFTCTVLQILSKFFTFSDNQNNFKFQYILTSHYKCKTRFFYETLDQTKSFKIKQTPEDEVIENVGSNTRFWRFSSGP